MSIEKIVLNLRGTRLRKLSESYGGAYDIDPEQYFTRDDLLDFSDDVIDKLAENGIPAELYDIDIDEDSILSMTVAVADSEYTVNKRVDMRRVIRKGRKVLSAYVEVFVEDFRSQIEDYEQLSDSKDYRVDNEYMRMKRSYDHYEAFSDIHDEAGTLQDLIDRLDSQEVAYEIYHNKKDNGCTVFYDGEYM